MEKLTHDELLSEWKSAREYKSFTNDGILIEDKWKQSSPKILFLLKESNAGFDNIAGRGWGPNGNSNTFWRRINICSYIITEIWNDRKPSFHEVATVKEREVNSIAYVNVKKNGENKSTSNNNEILQYARNDKDYLARQISIINPDVIYCGGTINSYKHLFPCE